MGERPLYDSLLSAAMALARKHNRASSKRAPTDAEVSWALKKYRERAARRGEPLCSICRSQHGREVLHACE